MKKNVIINLLAAIISLCTGCSRFDRAVMSDRQVEKKVLDEVIGYLENGDAEGIKGMMTESTLLKCKDDIDNQIKNMTELFSGKKIESYVVRSLGSEKSYREGEQTLYYISPEANEIKLDTGEEYTLRVYYYVINKKSPQKEGIIAITLNTNTNDKKMFIGEWNG